MSSLGSVSLRLIDAWGLEYEVREGGGGLTRGTVATGSSVTKTASGGEEIVVQGDNSDDIFDWVVDVGGVPDENVECIEDKKKKSAG